MNWRSYIPIPLHPIKKMWRGKVKIHYFKLHGKPRKTLHIPIKQLGVATGIVVIVNIIKD